MKPVKWSQANSADPDLASHVASNQGLHCLLTGFSIKNRIKRQNRSDTPKMTNELVQHITVEESISIQRVSKGISYSVHTKNILPINGSTMK